MKTNQTLHIEGEPLYHNRFGLPFKVVEYITENRILVHFPNTGYLTYTTSTAIETGGVVDKYALTYPVGSDNPLGYIGEGKYKPSIRGKQTRYFKMWLKMLEHVNITGTPMTPRWKNFQLFCQDLPSIQGEGSHLALDCLNHYSPFSTYRHDATHRTDNNNE